MTATGNAEPRPWVRRHPFWTIVIALGILLVLLWGWAWLAPFTVAMPPSQPASSYEDAIARIGAIQAAEKARGDVRPECESILMTHGGQTERVMTFLHGFTSCPEQFRVLGQEYFDQGYNVYIPRTPHHGLMERIDNETYQLTAEELAAFAGESADISQGLGNKVTVAGLSGGGTMAAWLAQHRPDIEMDMPIAPFLGIGFIPAALNRPVTHFLVLLPPKFYLWWDPIRKADNPFTSPYSYPRYSLRSLGEILKLGFATSAAAKGAAPAVPAIIMVSNASDKSVNNRNIDQLVDLWVADGARQVTAYRFPKDPVLPHDLITPDRLDNRVDVVYPVLHGLTQEAHAP